MESYFLASRANPTSALSPPLVVATLAMTSMPDLMAEQGSKYFDQLAGERRLRSCHAGWCVRASHLPTSGFAAYRLQKHTCPVSRDSREPVRELTGEGVCSQTDLLWQSFA